MRLFRHMLQRAAACVLLFSLAGAAFVPAMVLGIFWPGSSRIGAISGMLAGLCVTIYYMAVNIPAVRSGLHLAGDGLWWGIQPVSAGVFGVAAGVVVTVVMSVLRPDSKPIFSGFSESLDSNRRQIG